MTTGGRRGRYVPMDVNVAFKRFGTKLEKKWGMEGLCAWMLLLAAAKREPVQGTFTYSSESEVWTKLGATAAGFDFDTFITFCGRNKQTRKTRSGRVTYVEITGWKDWNVEWSREQDAQRKSRKRGVSTPDTKRTGPGLSSDTHRTEGEAEAEGEYEGEADQVKQAVDNQFGLPISDEKKIELRRIHDGCRGTDTRSMGVLEDAARTVSFAGVVRVRESVAKRGRRVGVGYAVNALKSEAKEAA